MSTSQNGWLASPTPSVIAIRPLVIGGASFAPGVAHHDYADVVLKYVLTQFHYRVEKLRPGWCWGYYFRANRNNPNSLSNHASGTAGDANAPLHPNGVATLRTFSPKQVAEINKILAEVDHVVRWGGNYRVTPDSMHFEINASRAEITRVGRALLSGKMGVKTSTPVKVITAVKPKPSNRKARVAVRAATGANVVNVNAITRLAKTNDDVRDVQRVLNAWFPHEKAEVDGVYGDQTYAKLDRARKAFKIAKPVSDVAARRATLKKLGLKVIN